MRKTISAMAVAVVLLVGLWFASVGKASVQQKQGFPALAATTGVSSAAKSKVAPGSGSEAEANGAAESEGTGANEAAATENDTHEDPNGQDVNHECPPNCDTASGEQP